MSKSRLPASPDEFQDYYTKIKPQEFLKVYNNPCKSVLGDVLQYSVSALNTGRPLGSVLTVVTGISTGGKTSTINALFDCPNLCNSKTSQYGSNIPVKVEKPIGVINTPQVVAPLLLIDSPGFFDSVISNGAVNLASVTKSVESLKVLRSPKKLEAKLKDCVDVRENVYPNIVLFTIKATENRITEDNSILKKAIVLLKEVPNLVDCQRPNLIVVLTNCMALGNVSTRFEQKLEEKRTIIQSIVNEVLGMSNVDVVPVENLPMDYDLNRMEDYYVLPNGDPSHKNLLTAAIALCNKNDDSLGEQIFTRFLKEKAKSVGARITIETNTLTKEDFVKAHKILKSHKMFAFEEFSIEPFALQLLGNGFCPVDEKRMTPSLLTANARKFDDIPLSLKVADVGGAKFLVPECVHVHPKKINRTYRTTFVEKPEYETYIKGVYQLDPNCVLSTNTNSNGKWVTGERTMMVRLGVSSPVINFIQEFQIATLSLNNPKDNVVSESFIKDLNSLPEVYTAETYHEYKQFFQTQGTHLVWEQSIGGEFKISLTLDAHAATKDNLVKITSLVTSVLEEYWNREKATGETGKRMAQAGVMMMEWEFNGGKKMENIKLLNPELLEEWLKTIPENPVELRGATRLFPYYNLVDNVEKAIILRKATEDYLSGEMRKKLKNFMKHATSQLYE